MPGTCEVLGCTTHSLMASNKPSFHRFPRDLVRKRLWIKTLQRVNRYGAEWAPKSHSRICGRHFIAGKPSQDPAHVDYVPSVFLTTEARVRREEFIHLCNTAKKQRLTCPGANTDDIYLACEALLSLSGSVPDKTPISPSTSTNPSPQNLLLTTMRTHTPIKTAGRKMDSYNVALKRETATLAGNRDVDDTFADPEALLSLCSNIPALDLSSSFTSTILSHNSPPTTMRTPISTTERSMMYNEIDALRTERDAAVKCIKDSEEKLRKQSPTAEFVKAEDVHCNRAMDCIYYNFQLSQHVCSQEET